MVQKKSTSRYRIRNWIEDELYPNEYCDQSSLDVYEKEDKPYATGVLDINGNEYMRFPDKKKIGFQLY